MPSLRTNSFPTKIVSQIVRFGKISKYDKYFPCRSFCCGVGFPYLAVLAACITINGGSHVRCARIKGSVHGTSNILCTGRTKSTLKVPLGTCCINYWRCQVSFLPRIRAF